jgi:hypothetical protein
MKWMTVTALATATVFGSFVESAKATHFFGSGGGFGRGYSNRDINDPIVLKTFFLANETLDGLEIKDENDTDPNFGLFREAIEEFNTYSDFVLNTSQDAVKFDPETGRPFNPDNPTQVIKPDSSFKQADLQAQFIENDLIDDVLGFMPSDSFNADIIVYSILRGRVELDRYFLFIGSGSPDFTNFDPDQATNSLNYILQQNILDRTFQDRPNTDGNEIRDFIEKFPEFNDLTDASANTISEEISVIPESSNTTALMALGILGAGLGLKHKRR